MLDNPNLVCFVKQPRCIPPTAYHVISESCVSLSGHLRIDDKQNNYCLIIDQYSCRCKGEF